MRDDEGDPGRIGASLDCLARREREAAGPDFERRLVGSLSAFSAGEGSRPAPARAPTLVVRTLRWAAPLAIAAGVMLAFLLLLAPERSPITGSRGGSGVVEEAAWADSLFDHLDAPLDLAIENDLGVLEADLMLLESDRPDESAGLSIEELIQ